MSATAPRSRWWYAVLAVPVYYALTTLAGFVLAFLAFATALAGATGPEPRMGLAVGLGFLGFFGAILFLVAIGMVLSLVFPVAIYLDAEAIGEAGGDWAPDPELYGLLGLVGIVAQPLQVPLGAYYLYQRHVHVGVP